MNNLFFFNRLVPNAIVRGKADKRQYVGDQMDNCTDFSSLYYRLPFEKVGTYIKCDMVFATEFFLSLISGASRQLGYRAHDMG